MLETCKIYFLAIVGARQEARRNKCKRARKRWLQRHYSTHQWRNFPPDETAVLVSLHVLKKIT